MAFHVVGSPLHPAGHFGLGPPVAPVLAPLGSLAPSRQSLFQTPGRYGSGAGSRPQPAPGLRRTRVRSRSSDEIGRPHRRAVSVPRRSQPAGPQEGAEWMDALNNARNSIETLDGQSRNARVAIECSARDIYIRYIPVCACTPVLFSKDKEHKYKMRPGGASARNVVEDDLHTSLWRKWDRTVSIFNVYLLIAMCNEQGRLVYPVE